MRIKDIAFHRVDLLDAQQLEDSRIAEATVVVKENTSALDAANLSDSIKGSLILVVDERDQITGLVSPKWVRERLKDQRGVTADNLAAALLKFSELPGEREHGFRHEWLNEAQPVLLWCKKGKHFIDDDPCPIHG